VNYPHWLNVTKPTIASGEQDEETGAFEEGTSSLDNVLYDGPCDVQELSLSVTRTNDGSQNTKADVQCFLADETKITEQLVGMPCTVRFDNGETADGEIVTLRRIDGSVMLRGLR
jgi:hypothetical protein